MNEPKRCPRCGYSEHIHGDPEFDREVGCSGPDPEDDYLNHIDTLINQDKEEKTGGSR